MRKIQWRWIGAALTFIWISKVTLAAESYDSIFTCITSNKESYRALIGKLNENLRSCQSNSDCAYYVDSSVMNMIINRREIPKEHECLKQFDVLLRQMCEKKVKGKDDAGAQNIPAIYHFPPQKILCENKICIRKNEANSETKKVVDAETFQGDNSRYSEDCKSLFRSQFP